MRKLFLITSAAMMAIAAPAIGAPPQGKGKGEAKAGKSHASAAHKNHRVSKSRKLAGASKPVRQARNSGSNYANKACPPGLAAKNNGCVPPGQAKRLFSQGQRLPAGYNHYSPMGSIPQQYYDQIPSSYRSGDYRYVYRNDSIYVVDPRTRIVESIIGLIR